jgi:hypothetical protein
MERMATRLPTPVENEPELREDQLSETEMMPTTLKVAMRTFPEVKILTEDVRQDRCSLRCRQRVRPYSHLCWPS